ncbi:MAG: DNA polymerase IV [Thermoleophilia bacterium]|nr:DNA polymerase IV [Thermoleophilia bacterium]MDH5282009.1 DNA polymerase IV [Thermoleophilia bacterium]
MSHATPLHRRVPILAHLDLDAFFAAVEELENPELRDRPLVVGGDPHGRGVVSTANYAARKFGIHSAMSAAEALRRCPSAVFVRPRHALYRQYSRVVWDTVGEIVPRIERTGIDEGYLDLGTVAPDFTRARAVVSAIQTAVRATTSLTCSLGVGTSKVVCKIGSDRRKPGGVTVVPPGTEAAFLAPLAVRLLPGVGPRAEARLRTAGVETIGALAVLANTDLKAVLPGSIGTLLRDRARGIDPRDLELAGEPVSVSAEDTFAHDVSERALLHDEIRRLAQLVSERLQNSGLSGRTVTAKLRYGDFSIRTRSKTLAAAVDEADVIGAVACGLLDRGLRDRPGALRLVGVGVSSLSSYRQLTLEP